MALFRELLKSGKVTPHIDRTYPLSEAPEALRHLQSGRVKGKLIITVPGPDDATSSPRRKAKGSTGSAPL